MTQYHVPSSGDVTVEMTKKGRHTSTRGRGESITPKFMVEKVMYDFLSFVSPRSK